MAVPKPMQTEFGIQHRLESCVLFFIRPSPADDGEVFQVKKTSHSRRLMKQLKAEKKREREEATAAAALEASKDGGLDADRATTAAAYSDALANIPFPSR